jgi:hypothetical protein
MTLLYSRPTLNQLVQVIEGGVKFETTKLVCMQAANMIISLRKPLLDDIQSLKVSMSKIERQIEQLLKKSDTEDGQVDGAKQPAETTATTVSKKISSRKRNPISEA